MIFSTRRTLIHRKSVWLLISLALVISVLPLVWPNVHATSPYGVEAGRLESPVMLQLGDAVSTLRVPPPAGVGDTTAQSATVHVVYIVGKNRWDDTCISPPTAAQNAMRSAADIWQTQLHSTIPIVIEACWSTSLPSNALGYSAPRTYYRDFAGAPRPHTWYAVSLANTLHGADMNSSLPEMDIAFNAAFDDGTWYFGTDGQPSPWQLDFVSVALHEIAHGLGFVGSMQVSNGVGSWGGGTGYPVIYDRYGENGAGQVLVQDFPNHSTALGH